MIDVFELYNKVCGTVNTHQAGMIKPQRQFVEWVNDESAQLFEEKFAGAWQKNQKITDDLSAPFLRSLPVKVIDGGIANDIIRFPPEYGHISAIRFYHRGFTEFPEIKPECEDPVGKDDYRYQLPEEVTEQEVDIVDNARWGAIFKHKTRKPKFDRPYATQFEGGFKIAPKGISYVVVDFLRRPKLATFKYTVGTDDYIVYDKANSQPLEWSSLVINEFINRAEMKYGKFTRDAFIYQAGEKEKATTL